MRRHLKWLAPLALLALLAAGCGDDDDDDDGGDGGLSADGATVPATGSIDLFLEADRAAANDAVVSLGVPFPPGALSDPTMIRVLDPGGTEIASHSASLATWPVEGTQRSVLVAFRVTLAMAQKQTWKIAYGAPRERTAATLAANPDGPVAATLPPAWYGQSRVIGYQIPAAANLAFADFETEIERYLANMSPAWTTYGLSCGTTSAERTYYDGPHALYQRFIHRGGAAPYRRAREEAVWYRVNELMWYENDEVAIYKCQTWSRTTALDWGVVRRMLGQSMLDDWLLSGDPEARRALFGLGEAFVRNLDALTSGREIVVKVTERNMAWPMMGLASYYAANPTPAVKAALMKLVDMTIAWQAAGTSGAFEHDIVRPDPSECDDGPRGGSPFMTSLLIDGLMDSWFVTGDARIPPVVVRAAEWYREDAVTTDGLSFRYLWGCASDPYDETGGSDLNLLISHVFGAAYVASGRDAAWLDFGDRIARAGLDNIYGGAPKQWSQSTRGFLKYIGYRALGRTP